MIRYYEKEMHTDDKPYIEAAGLSTDTKPTDCVTGSVFIEVDTANAYLFDEVSGDWEKV